MRARDDSQFDVRVTRDGDVARIAIGAIDKNGLFRNGVNAHARVVAPDQSVSDVPIRQVGPGSYQGEFDVTRKGGPFLVRVLADSAGVSRTLDFSYPDEYHFYPPNIDLLRAVSTETGGKFQPEVEEIFDSHGETTAVPVPVWPYLAGLAAALYLADVLLRRVRVFVG
jgi:hypothetical protein